MGNYKIKDTITGQNNAKTNSSNNGQHDQEKEQANVAKANQQEKQQIVDDKSQQQGHIATEQQLPQTGVTDYSGPMYFMGSCTILLIALLFKIYTNLKYGDN